MPYINIANSGSIKASIVGTGLAAPAQNDAQNDQNDLNSQCDSNHQNDLNDQNYFTTQIADSLEWSR